MDSNLTAIIAAFLTVGIPGGISLYLQLKRHKSDTTKTGAEASDAYAKAAANMAQQNIELSNRIDRQDKRIDEQDKLIRAQTIKIDDLQMLVEDLREWADRLCHQVKSIGGVPVEVRYRPSRAADK